MNCPKPSDWDLLAMEALEAEQAAPMLKHARACQACDELFQAARRGHAERVRMYEAFDRDHDGLRVQLMAALPDELPQRAGAVRLVRGWARLGDLVMSLNNTTARRAVAVLVPAACIVIAVAALLNSANGVAFAAVLERIRQARTMACDVVLTIRSELSAELVAEADYTEGAPPRLDRTTRGKLFMYSDGATRAWLLEQDQPPLRQLTLPDRTIVTKNGKHSVVKLTDDPNAPEYFESPDVWLRHLLALAGEPDARLGKQVVAGQEAVGFEIAAARLQLGLPQVADDPGSVVRLWVGIKSGLPLRLEFNLAQHIGPTVLRIASTWDRIRWDVPLDPQMFQPPEISQADEVQDLGLPAASEQALLAGLRAYAEQSARLAELIERVEQAAARKPGGAERLAQVRQWVHAESGYPPKLDLQSLGLDMTMRSAFMRARLLAERAKRRPAGDAQQERQRRAAEDEQLRRESDQLQRVVAGAGMFYRKLIVEGRQPEYFGKTVRPGQADAVLLRWRLADGRLRVVYGDLRVATVAGSE